MSSFAFGRRRSWLCVVLSALLVGACLLAADDTSSAASKVVVSLNFDDNLVSQYTLGFERALRPAGVSATFYINSGTVGTSGKMSWSQVSSLTASRDEIGGKSVDGINLTTLRGRRQISEICDDRKIIIAHGVTPITFAYPSGANNPTIQSDAKRCGYGNARTAGGLSPGGSTHAEPLPPKSWLALPAYAPGGRVRLSDLESLVSDAAAQGGGWIPIVIKHVCSSTLDRAQYSTCTSFADWIRLGDLRAFISWVRNVGLAGGAPAGTVFQTMGRTAISADTVAPATAISCDGSRCRSKTYHKTVYVRLLATDLGSGTASTHFTLNGSVPTRSSPTYLGRFPLTATATVKYRSWDYAGNADATHSRKVSVSETRDTRPPVTTIACNGGRCRRGPYHQPVIVTFKARDNKGGWGVARTYYTTNGSTPTTSSAVYTRPFTIHRPMTIKFFSTDLAGNAARVKTTRIRVQTVVSLTFDDQYENQWLYGVPLLLDHNMTGTYYVITSDSDAGHECCMSWGQLDTLQALGNDIGSHTIDHPNLTTLSVSRMTREVCGSRRDMIRNGIADPESFAYPFGTFNSTAERIVKKCRFNNARTGGGISNSNFRPTHPYIESIPPRHRYAIRTIAVDGASPMKLSDLKSFVKAAAAHGGGWLPINFHDICDASAADFRTCMSKYGSVQDTVLGRFLDWLAAAGRPGGAPAGVVVKNVCQALNCP